LILLIFTSQVAGITGASYLAKLEELLDTQSCQNWYALPWKRVSSLPLEVTKEMPDDYEVVG
jgi:hypothetical protein